MLLTEKVSQAGMPTFFAFASSAILERMDFICGGAGVTPGRAVAALISRFSGSESFVTDISTQSFPIDCLCNVYEKTQ
jgi:hypothetical protein